MPDPFISTQDLTDYIGRDVTADPGAVSAVDAACVTVRTLAEQDFDAVAGDVVTLDGTDTDCLLLPQLPVSAAGTVTVFGTALDAASYALADGGRLIRLGGTATTLSDWWGWGFAWGGYQQPWPPEGFPFGPLGAVWPRGRQNVQVTYDHGSGTVPADVRMVALSLATRLVIQGPAIMETLGIRQQVRYAGPPMDLTSGEKAILAKYRLVQ